MDRLRELGFVPAGCWHLVDGLPEFLLRTHACDHDVLYAFTVDGRPKYIARTGLPIKKRMGAYQHPRPEEAGNNRVHEHITHSLKAGHKVEILVLPDDGSLTYRGHRIRLADGLERDLLAQLDPQWNELGGDEPANPHEEATRADPADPNGGGGRRVFQLQLHDAYCETGYFNVPISHTRQFGADGEAITILLGDTRHQTEARINRTTNKNGTPRIMGGTQLRDWLADQHKYRKHILVEVISETRVRLGG